ncbi:unnamed protein product [Leptidea sinapis]|uniref:Uncharacterized protein n=1 Tax=Leptidea sinapis TaxID=189913 RepID=A0A5E4PSA0_9NEOP|nr:unnamed protein product [Leptidea sinapis]
MHGMFTNVLWYLEFFAFVDIWLMIPDTISPSQSAKRRSASLNKGRYGVTKAAFGFVDSSAAS